MRYLDFQQVLSASRMNRYLSACGGNTRKAMTLYRKNLLLTQELFTVIGCFEVGLRNTIDQKAISILGQNWLRVSYSQLNAAKRFKKFCSSGLSHTYRRMSPPDFIEMVHGQARLRPGCGVPEAAFPG